MSLSTDFGRPGDKVGVTVRTGYHGVKAYAGGKQFGTVKFSTEGKSTPDVTPQPVKPQPPEPRPQPLKPGEHRKPKGSVNTGEAPAARAVPKAPRSPRVPRAVFFDLGKLRKDDEVDVHRADGTTAVFAVDAIGTYEKDAFPTDKVYGDTRGRAELRPITCGGNLTPDRHWDANVVVFAHLTGEAQFRTRYLQGSGGNS
ncbi:sortase domain-bontaining protein [Streptomyces sp. 147326]|uniref:sortase domain-containing protein n=1 Tax=Streptomyces sp. 147326 TaxID=3074379 RepID=UPI00385795C5